MHAMERRGFNRKNVNIDAEIITDDSTYTGIIKNISERGIGLETTSENPLSAKTRFPAGTKIQIRFHTSPEEVMMLNCKVVWSFKTGTQGMIKRIGLEVIFPPPNYIEFCKAS
jgi:hypothetical protein